MAVTVAGAVSAACVSSAAAQTVGLPGGVGDGSALKQVLSDAGQQLNGLGSKAPSQARPSPKGDSGRPSGSSAPRSPSATTSAGSHAAAPRQAAPSRATYSSGTGAASGSASAARSAAAPSKGGSSNASKAKAASSASSNDPTNSADAADRATGAATGSGSGDVRSLPFTGSRPLQWVALGLLMGLTGLALRRVGRGRQRISAG
jgi:eukaryotic-like serine/threonine-protein kinase